MDKPKSEEDKHNQDSRVTIISAVQTPLGFFVLVVLIVEIIFGILTNFSSGNDKTYLIIGMLALIFLLVFIVAGMAVFRPMALYGKQTRQKTSPSPATSSDAPNEIHIQTIEKPRILWACNWAGSSPFGELMMDKDTTVIRRAFPKSSLTIEKELTADKFRELLTKNKFDIVQLTVNVSHDGNIVFSENDRIPSQGVVQLLEVSNTRLLILGSCNSVPLAAGLAVKTNMVAATGNVPDVAFESWEKLFYRLLSDGLPLSRAFSISSNAVEFIELPIVILMKQDLIFKK